MMAIILAGGVGTRLKPFTVTIPKPLLPLGDMPILDIVIRQLASYGVNRIVLSLGHMAPFFMPFLAQWEQQGVTIETCFENDPLGTAGPIGLVKDLEDNFIVMNGDVLTTLDFSALVEAHRTAQSWGTIAVSKREMKVDFGVVTTTESNVLKEYREKPLLTYDVSMGINVLSKNCLEFISRGKKIDMPDLMITMKKAGKLVHCFRSSCYWLDMGRFDDYEQASRDFVETPERFLLPKRG
ncbi:MAG: sugar phosphate nucleotidyltransferase [bacterium]